MTYAFNNWDLVVLAARHVVGLWLVDKPKDVLHELSRSDNMWERQPPSTRASH